MEGLRKDCHDPHLLRLVFSAFCFFFCFLTLSSLTTALTLDFNPAFVRNLLISFALLIYSLAHTWGYLVQHLHVNKKVAGLLLLRGQWLSSVSLFLFRVWAG